MTEKTRKEFVQDIIDRGDVEELANLLSGACACLGARDGEPECWCKMTYRQVSEAISVFALKCGRLVRLNGQP